MKKRSSSSRTWWRAAFALLLFALVVVFVALLRPAVREPERIATRASSAGAAPTESEIAALSAPPKALEHEVAAETQRTPAPPQIVAELARASATVQRPSFILELTLDAPDIAAEALQQVKIEVDPEVLLPSSPPRTEASAPAPCSIDALTFRGKPTQDIGPLCVGMWTVRVGGPGFRGDSQSIQCYDDGARIRATLRVSAKHVFVVTIRDVDGAPLERSTRLAEDLRAQVVDRVTPCVCTEAPRAPATSRSSCTAALYRSKSVGKDRPGEFEVETDAKGTLWVGALFGDVVLAWVELPATSQRIELVVSADAVQSAFRSVEVRVRDRDHHAAISGAQVNLMMSGGRTQELLTDANGTARSRSVLPGAGKVRVSKDGYANAKATFDASSDAAVVLEIELAPEAVLRGVLLDTEGVPVASTVVALSETATLIGREDMIDDRIDTAPDGSFVLRGLAPGTYLLADNRQRSALFNYTRLSALQRDQPPAYVTYVTRVDASNGGVSELVVRTTPMPR